MCGIAVVGQQQQSRRFAVKPSDREEATNVSRQEVDDRSTPFVVADRRDHSAGLVDDPIARLLAEQAFTVQPDVVDARIGAVAEIRDATIHGHALFDHELLDVATRTEAGTGQ
jgi:hypothetical protein